jgi:hypothetical protein
VFKLPILNRALENVKGYRWVRKITFTFNNFLASCLSNVKIFFVCLSLSKRVWFWRWYVDVCVHTHVSSLKLIIQDPWSSETITQIEFRFYSFKNTDHSITAFVFVLHWEGVVGTALIVLSISRLMVDGMAGMVENCSLKIDSLCLIQVKGDLYVLLKNA